jgi:hypothetical protein
MIGAHGILRWFRVLWMSAWPLWTLMAFACLAFLPVLPGGYVRAALAAPILLVVPGSLTLGAVFSQRRRPKGAVFACYAALLGVIWSVFTSLVLYARHLFISLTSTYFCLLVICAVLAITAESRLLLGRGTGRRAARRPETLNPDLSDAEADDNEAAAVRGTGYYALAAVAAGVSLLAGGLYSYDHLPHPAPVGFSWMAWTGPPIKGKIAIGSSGTKLDFQIIHHQSDSTTFRLSAAWLGNPSRSLAKPLTLSLGPNRTFRGSLVVPPLPDGCTYRIVVTLTGVRQIDTLTKKTQTWTINADVHDPRKSLKTCKR